MQLIIYDNRFDLNEIITLCGIASGYSFFFFFRKTFPALETVLYLLLGIFTGLLLDHLIGAFPIDYYDVNDTSNLEFFDFLTYINYGPYGYFFLYFYKRLRIKSPATPLYILLWALISMFAEFIGVAAGVFHYKNGYEIYFSFPIYLVVLMLFIFLYKFVQSQKSSCKSKKTR